MMSSDAERLDVNIDEIVKEAKSPTEKAYGKMVQLMSCENERVALAAAKEVLSACEKKEADSDGTVELEVTIKVI